MGSFFAKNESIFGFSFRSFSGKFLKLPLVVNKNTRLMTVSMETVRMVKSRPRKNQSERADLPQDYLAIYKIITRNEPLLPRRSPKQTKARRAVVMITSLAESTQIFYQGGVESKKVED